ncbi:MAG TPA: DoxX family protein [Beijerinckiaceae bacterium]|jgi:putative oxidoreductase|nr:DoxX family protein [Microvirga sp.]HZB37858.1 DoxX family protein [Beijerinckiaceae bacterium]
MWNLVYAIGRVLLVALFIKSGVEKLIDPSGLAGMLSGKAFPMPMVFAYLAGVAEVGLGILVAIGWQTRIAAFGLVAFTIVATLLAHNYWDMTGAARRANETAFWKNLAIIGGLLMLMASGAGRFSVDRR